MSTTKSCQTTKTEAVYMPSRDKNPIDPDTIKTNLKQGQQVTEKCSQEYATFTGVLQLQLLTSFGQTKKSNVILCPGGIHTLVSFVGSVETIMKGSGLK